MITFNGNRQILKSAQLLESRARNTYPHISTSKIRTHIGYDTKTPSFLERIKKDYSLIRRMIKESGEYYTALIYSLSFGKIGNCTEDAMLTELLGKINGQQNIYTGCIRIKKDKDAKFLDHVVAFITDKPIEHNKECQFKNKEAIIIDPWLGVSDFAENYFTKLKTIYRKIFMYHKNKAYGTFTNDNLANELIRAESNTVKEFKSKKKDFFPKTELSIVPFTTLNLDSERLEELKTCFPELVINQYKIIQSLK